jgi:hypothetical protein
MDNISSCRLSYPEIPYHSFESPVCPLPLCLIPVTAGAEILLYVLFCGFEFPTFCQSKECTNVGCLVTQGTKFCTVVLDNFTIIAVSALAYKNVFQFTCTNQKVPDNNEIHRSLHVFIMELASC